MEYVQMTINDWLEVKHKLKMELQGVKQSFVRIGYLLRKIDDQKAYESDGYKSIAEFAKAEYGLEASTVSRFMSINREYSIDGYSEHLREEYLDMGRSQLEEMLKLPDKDREMIRPEASRENIRELKRFNKTEPAAGIADDIKGLITKFFEENPDVLKELFNGEQKTTQQRVELVNPSGNRSFKKGLFFMMMYEENIKIKKFGADSQTMRWQEFFSIAKIIFEETADSQIEEADSSEEVESEETEATEKSEPEPTRTSGVEYADRNDENTPKKDVDEKNGKNNGQRAEKVEIAPAQKSEKHSEIQVKEPHQSNVKTEEKTVKKPILQEENVDNLTEQNHIKDQIKVENDFQEHCSTEEEQSETIMNSPYITRKEYLGDLSDEEAGEYMAMVMGEAIKKLHNVSFKVLVTKEFWQELLKAEVDENGRQIEEG